MASFGEVARYARQRRGVTQADLAADLGVGRTQLVNVETGRFQPSIATIEELSLALGARFTCADGIWSVVLEREYA